MKYEEIKKLINNVIENEFRKTEGEALQGIDEETNDKYWDYNSKIIELQGKIKDSLTEELRECFFQCEELVTKQFLIEIEYYFREGVRAGVTNLKFLSDIENIGIIL